MRYGAAFIVKRFAPMIGRPESPRRITVAHQTYTLVYALEFTAGDRWSGVKPKGPLWIEKRGQPATRSVGL